MTNAITKTDKRKALSRVTSRVKQGNPVQLYLDNLAPSGRRSMRSLLGQAAAIWRWSGALETMPWHQLRYAQVASLRAALRQTSKQPSTINTTLAAVRGVVKAALLLGRFPQDEWLRIQAITRVAGKSLPAGRQLRGTEVSKLLEACQRDPTDLGLRDAALLALLAYAGLRRSEVVALDVEDYCRRSGRLQVRQGKGQRQRELVLPMTARLYLRSWLKVCGSTSGPLFRQLANHDARNMCQRISASRVYGILQQRAQEAGIAHCSPHDLRRTFVTQLLEQGVDFNTTRQLAGHQNIQTTTLYDRRPAKAQQRVMENFGF